MISKFSHYSRWCHCQSKIYRYVSMNIGGESTISCSAINDAPPNESSRIAYSRQRHETEKHHSIVLFMEVAIARQLLLFLKSKHTRDGSELLGYQPREIFDECAQKMLDTLVIDTNVFSGEVLRR